MTTKDLTDLIFVLLAATGLAAIVVWIGTGIGMAARHLVQLHADRVAERLSERRDR